ncbi:hypothetical protein BJX96DRAFT_144509 [Aspergillus floccosus]
MDRTSWRDDDVVLMDCLIQTHIQPIHSADKDQIKRHQKEIRCPNPTLNRLLYLAPFFQTIYRLVRDEVWSSLGRWEIVLIRRWTQKQKAGPPRWRDHPKIKRKVSSACAQETSEL